MLSGCNKTENTQVLLVTGGYNGGRLSSTEVSLSSGKSLRFGEIDKQNDFPLSVQMLLVDNQIESKDVTTRWPSTQVAANWSGGRWREDSFLRQGTD